MLNVFYDLFQPSKDGETALVRDLSIKYIKYHFCVFSAFLEITICHGNFIEVGEEGNTALIEGCW